MRKMVYADNAATTKLDNSAFEAMVPWLTEEYGNPSQPYSFSRNAKKVLIEARKCIAECINALPEEIFFTSGGTESNNWALKGILWNKPISCGVITSEFEHHAVINACSSLKELGYDIKYVAPSNEGYVERKSFEKAISPSTIMASIMMVNNELGTIQPIKELCDIAHKYGLLFHTDAVQALGHVKIDVKELDVDLLSGSAHKFNGPKGIGFMYIKKGTPISALVCGGSQEKGMRAGTENVASIVGMAVALKNNCENIDKNRAFLNFLTKTLLSELSQSNLEFVINGSDYNKLPGLLSISFLNADGEMLLHRLDLMGISISTGAACDRKDTRASHVLKSIHLDECYAKGTIRVSFGKNNTAEEAKAIANAIIKILG